MRRGIRKAKAEHQQQIESQLSKNNLWQVLQAIQQIINFRAQTNTEANSSIALKEGLNSSFAQGLDLTVLHLNFQPLLDMVHHPIISWSQTISRLASLPLSTLASSLTEQNRSTADTIAITPHTVLSTEPPGTPRELCQDPFH